MAQEVQVQIQEVQVQAKEAIKAAWRKAMRRPKRNRGMYLSSAVMEALKALGGAWPLVEKRGPGAWEEKVNRLEVNGIPVGHMTTFYDGYTTYVAVSFPDGDILEWVDPYWRFLSPTFRHASHSVPKRAKQA